MMKTGDQSRRGATACCARLIVLAGLLAASNTVGAAPEQGQGKPHADKRSTDAELDRTLRALAKSPPRRQMLRCWQDGRLIVERRVDRAALAASAATQSADAGQGVRLRGLRLYDLRGAFCVLE